MLELEGEVTETEGLARARPRNSYRVCEATGESSKGERGRDLANESRKQWFSAYSHLPNGRVNSCHVDGSGADHCGSSAC